MGYLGDGRLGLYFGRFGRIDPKYFGRWEIDLVREQRNGRNRKIHGSTYLGAGRLAVIKVGDWEIETPPIGGFINRSFLRAFHGIEFDQYFSHTGNIFG